LNENQYFSVVAWKSFLKHWALVLRLLFLRLLLHLMSLMLISSAIARKESGWTFIAPFAAK